MTKTTAEPDVNLFAVLMGRQQRVESSVVKKFCQKAICQLCGLNPEFQGKPSTNCCGPIQKGLAQDCNISSVLAMEILQSYAKPLMLSIGDMFASKYQAENT